MFLIKRNIFTMDNGIISEISYDKHLFNGRMGALHKKVLNSYLPEKQFYRNSVIIIENEEIYTKNIIIPSLNTNKIEKAIRDELKFYYKIDQDITFTYSVLNKNKNNIELQVFYINNNYLNNIRLNKIKAVYLIQFCYSEYLNSLIKDDNYILVFLYNNRLYMMFYNNGLLKYNYIFRNFKEELEEFNICVQYFIDMNKDIEGNLKCIYILGLKNEISVNIKNSYVIKNLGEVKENELFERIV